MARSRTSHLGVRSAPVLFEIHIAYAGFDVDIPDESRVVESQPTVRVDGRTLVVFAGLPGAGKSTLLGRLSVDGAVSVLDSEQVRKKLRTALCGRIPYRWYRIAVHATHRARIGWHCVASPNPVLVHEPATRATTRVMLVILGWLTHRERVLVWLHVRPIEALNGQYVRGRLIRARSFRRHARRAELVHRKITSRPGIRGWDAVHVFARPDLEHGLRVRTTE